MFYELLAGKRPFASASPAAEAMARLRQNAPPLSQLGPEIPAALSEIVAKCLARSCEKRYQSADELIAALDQWTAPRPSLLRRRAALGWAAIALALGLSLLIWRISYRGPAPRVPSPVSVLVEDFENRTAEPVFDGTLEQMFTIALEDATFISSFSRAQAHKIAREISGNAEKLSEAVARGVAAREGIAIVIGARVSPAPTGYDLRVRAVEGVSGKVLLENSQPARTKDEVLTAAIRLAGSIRKALGDRTADDAIRERGETFTAASIGAMQAYALGQQRLLEGNYDRAVVEYRRAVALDPRMGRAYAGLATVYYNQKLWNDAEQNFQQALGQLDRMTERERYRTRGGYYIQRDNVDKAIEEFSSLVEKYPADNAGFANLALAYFYRGDMKRASQYGRKALEIYPHNVAQLNNVAWYALYSGDFETAEREATEALKLNPFYAKAALTIGLSQVGRGQYAEAANTYARLQTIGDHGRDFAALAKFDLAMMESKPQEALAALSQTPAGNDLVQVSTAEISWVTGDRPGAIARAQTVPVTGASVQVKLRIGNLLISAGKLAEAKRLADDLINDPARLRKASGLVLAAEIAMAKRQYTEAADLLSRSKEQEDTWWGRWVSARNWQALGRLAEAHSDLDECIRRKGEAVAAFLDDVPTARYVPAVLELRRAVESQLKLAASRASSHTR